MHVESGLHGQVECAIEDLIKKPNLSVGRFLAVESPTFTGRLRVCTHLCFLKSPFPGNIKILIEFFYQQKIAAMSIRPRTARVMSWIQIFARTFGCT